MANGAPRPLMITHATAPIRRIFERRVGRMSSFIGNLTHPDLPELPRSGENSRQLVWWDNLELIVHAIARTLVVAPTAKLRGVSKAISLHVIVGNLHDQLRT